jgi:polyisoprenoid-binding protein YceI
MSTPNTTVPDTQATTTWTIDPAHSVVELAVKHMMFSTVKGRFPKVAGTIALNEADQTASSVVAEIETASVDTGEPTRDAHLRSPDFLHAETFPLITFRSTEFVPRGRDRVVVVGDLTIHGVTREVSLDVELLGTGLDPWGNQRAGFSATTTINRRDFGLTWNQALEAGGVLVSDQVKISLEIQATAQAS